jgi:hypothetical protein
MAQCYALRALSNPCHTIFTVPGLSFILQKCPCQKCRWQISTTLKNAVFWDVAPCESFKNRFGGTCRLHLQGKVRVASFMVDGGEKFLRNAGYRIPTRCHIPEDGILHSHRRENLKSHVNDCVFIVL